MRPRGVALPKHLPGKLADHGAGVLACRRDRLWRRLRSLCAGADARAHLLLGVQVAALRSDAPGPCRPGGIGRLRPGHGRQNAAQLSMDQLLDQPDHAHARLVVLVDTHRQGLELLDRSVVE